MKRLSLLTVGLLSAILIFSVVGLADTDGTADATLTITDVIDIDVTNTDNSAEITQDSSGTVSLNTWNSAGSGGSNSLSNIPIGSFTLDLITLSDYTIAIDSYTETWDHVNNGTEEINSNALEIKCTSSSDGTISTNTWKSVGANVGAENPLDLSNDFSQANNLDTAGEQVVYDMQIVPSNLTKDFESGDTITFRMNIAVTEKNL